MKEFFRNVDPVAFLFTAFVATLAFTLLIGLAAYSFSDKKHCGYYLGHNGSTYNVWINWENAPDEIAYRSYDEESTMKAYAVLISEPVID